MTAAHHACQVALELAEMRRLAADPEHDDREMAECYARLSQQRLLWDETMRAENRARLERTR